MNKPENWAYFSVAEMIVAVVSENEEVTLKDISSRLRSVNSGHWINTNAINKAISLFLVDILTPIGKNIWRVNSHEGELQKRSNPQQKLSKT
jgi:hypothetical protein